MNRLNHERKEAKNYEYANYRQRLFAEEVVEP